MRYFYCRANASMWYTYIILPTSSLTSTPFLRLIHSQANTKGPLNYTCISKFTYCIIIISSTNLFWIIRYLNSLLHVAKLLLRGLAKKLPSCLWLPKFPYHVIQSISALNYFSKLCFIVVSPVILICLEIYRPYPFLYSIFPPFLMHRLLTKSSWIDKQKCKELSLRLENPKHQHS